MASDTYTTPFGLNRKTAETVDTGDLTMHVTADSAGRPVAVTAYLHGKEIFRDVEGEIVERVAATLVHQRQFWREGYVRGFNPDMVCPVHGYSDFVDGTRYHAYPHCADCEKARKLAQEERAAGLQREAELDPARGDPYAEPAKSSGSDLPF